MRSVDATCADVRAITLAHAAEARRKIADLVKLEQVLTHLAAGCRGGRVPQCPIVDALFAGA